MKREYVGVVMLPEHKRALERLARVNGEAMAVVIRCLIREEAQRRGLWPTAERAECELRPQEAAHA